MIYNQNNNIGYFFYYFFQRGHSSFKKYVFKQDLDNDSDGYTWYSLEWSSRQKKKQKMTIDQKVMPYCV